MLAVVREPCLCRAYSAPSLDKNRPAAMESFHPPPTARVDSRPQVLDADGDRVAADGPGAPAGGVVSPRTCTRGHVHSLTQLTMIDWVRPHDPAQSPSL